MRKKFAIFFKCVLKEEKRKQKELRRSGEENICIE